MFPARRHEVKMIVAEIDERIVFACTLFIEKKQGIDVVIGHIHDFLMSGTYGLLDNPEEILMRMIFSLEGIAWLNGCE